MSDEDSDPIYQENPESPEDEDPICHEEDESLSYNEEEESSSYNEEEVNQIPIDYTRKRYELLERINEDARKGMFLMIIWKFLMEKWYSDKHMPLPIMMEAWISALRKTETGEAKDWEKILMFLRATEWKEFPQEIQDCFARLSLKRNTMISGGA
jgi:hypothetical protein